MYLIVHHVLLNFLVRYLIGIIVVRGGKRMKVKVICRKEEYDKYTSMLKAGGFTISEDADLIFTDQTMKVETIVGKYNNTYHLINYKDIIYVESFGHEIILHTVQKEYLIKEKLYEVEGMLEGKGFIRVNKSCVINKSQIQEIQPTFKSKFILLMNDQQKIDVTRSYYQRFKERIGL